MKNSVFALLIFFSLTGISTISPAQNNEWNELAITHAGTEPRHTAFIYYADEQSALKEDPEASPYYKSLNGIWKFS